MANEARLNLVISAQDQAKTVIEQMVNNIKSAFDGLGNLTVGSNFATDIEEQLRDMLIAVEESTNEIRNVVDTLDNGFSEMTSSSERMVEAVSMGFETMSRNITESTDQMVQSLDNMGQSAQHIDESLDFMNLQMAGQMIQQVGEQITGFFEHAVSSAADFDQNIVNTTASLDANMDTMKLSTQQINAMKDAAIQMGEAGFFSANDVGQALNTMAKQGLTYQQIMGGGIQTVYKVAAANQQNLEDTANVVSDIYNEMGDIFTKSGMSAQQAADQIGNSMTVALHHARLSMDDFMNSMKYVGPQASAMGVGIKDVSTAIAVLGEHGIKGSQAGSALRRLFTNLTPASKAAAEEMKKLGMITADGANIFYDSAGKMKPMAEVQQLLHDKLSALNPEQEQFAIKTIFGQYALSSLTALVGTAPSKYQALTAAMNNNNTMTDIMKEKSKGLGMELNVLSNHWITIQKTIGESLKPVVESLISGLNSLMKAWEGLNPHVQQFLIISAAVTGVVLLIGGALLAFVGTIGMFSQAWGAGLVVLGAITTPALIVIGVIAAIGVAIAALSYAWIHNLGGIQQKAEAVWSAISSLFTTTMSAIEKVVNEALSAITKWWDDNWTTMQTAFTNVMKVLVAVLTPTIMTMTTIISAGIGFIKGAWQSGWQAIVSILKGAWDLASGVVKTAWSVISGIISVALDLLSGNFRKAGSDFVNIFKNAFSNITSMFSNLAQDAYNFGANFVHMIANGITGAVGSVVSAVSNVAGQIKNFLGFHSPTREGPASESDVWAPNFVNMMAKGIKEHTPQIQAAVNGIALSMKTGVTSVNHNISTNQISIPANNRTNPTQPNINIYIDGRSAKTDNDLAEIIAHKIYRQMPVVS